MEQKTKVRDLLTGKVAVITGGAGLLGTKQAEVIVVLWSEPPQVDRQASGLCPLGLT